MYISLYKCAFYLITYFRYEAQEGYESSGFRIQPYVQDMRVVTPSEFMQGCLKKMVGMIRTIEPVMKQLLMFM